MIKREVIEKVLDTVRVEEVVGDFVDLKKRGSSLIGVCPFHNEKTPSFYVSVAKGIYKCFGCGAGGDALKFVMEVEKYTYPEAIRYLANKYNIEVEEERQTAEQVAAQDKRESLYILSKWAGKYFVDQLWTSEEGRSIGLSYFKERGYREDIIKKFELGYSPNSWDALVSAAKQAGFAEEYLKEVGLVVERDDKSIYDRFRGRVMFPIANLTGRVIGFGGRTLKTDKKVPKYVNSPESSIYHKSDVLYGLNLAKKAISDKDVCYLVEGYADVISMHQANVENVVSSSGTSLTTGQIKLISRFTKNVTILYDGDAAGIKASLRGTDMLLEEGLNVKVLLFPDGHDPDSYVQKFGSENFQNYIAEHPDDFVLFKTKILLKDAKDDPIRKAEVIRDVVESIALIPDEIKVSVYIQRCSSLLGMEERILMSELNKIRIAKAKAQDKKNQSEKFGAGPGSVGYQDDQPPADLFADPPVGGTAAPTVAPAVGAASMNSSEVLMERELVRVFLNYGELLTTWEEEEDNQMPIAPFLLANIEDVEFEDKACRLIIEAYRKKAADFELPDVKSFVSHEDADVSSLAVSCLASRYELSPNWNDDKRKIYVSTEEEHLKDLTTQVVYRLKKKKVERKLLSIREELKMEQSADDMAILIANYQKYKEMEVLLGGLLGNTIVK